MSFQGLSISGLKIMNDSNNATTTTLVLYTMGIAAFVAVSLPFLQSDFVSRLFLLNLRKLQSKRQKSYAYAWSRALCMYRERALDEESVVTATLVLKLDELLALVQECITHPPTLLSIQKDPEDPTQEYYLFFKLSSTKIYQVPLVEFGDILASYISDNTITTTTFCFVADASSNKGINLIASLCEELQAGVAVIRQPLWMALLAALLELQLYEETKLQRVLFALCRLEGLRVVKKHEETTSKKIRTILVTLPGQATTPALLHNLLQVFSHERHVFVYDGCINSVKSGLQLLRRVHNNNNNNSAFTHPVQVTTPLSNNLCKQIIPALYEPLSQLPIHIASITETWMSSVNAFLEMKQQHERTNNYLPFVCKLSYLLLEESSTTSKLALTNLLQFITGSRSRPLSSEFIDAAFETWRDLLMKETNTTITLSKSQIKSIEACVFLHHGILIENKTLLDTVMPAKEWTLKAAKKISGCACCAPEDEDEEEMRDNNSLDVPGAFAGMGIRNNIRATKKERPKYVDGKMGFAFDPTAFS